MNSYSDVELIKEYTDLLTFNKENNGVNEIVNNQIYRLKEELERRNYKIDNEYGLIADSDGSIEYKTKNNLYSLLEGKTSNDLTSDILFIYREPKFLENDVIPGEVVDFIYGGFSNDNLKNVEEIIKKYEEANYE